MTRSGKSSNARGNWLLLTVSIAVSLAILEVAARLVLAAPLPWRYPQIRYVSDPELVFKLEPNQRSYTRDKLATINERGLRGPLVPYERRPGMLRLLFLGDSVMFGHGVEDDEVAAQQVGALLDRDGIPSEVINSSVPSYNTEQEVRFLETEGVRYDPDWVLVGYYWNDVSPKSTVRVSRDGWLMNEGVDEDKLTTWQRFWISEDGFAIRNQVKRVRFLYGASLGWAALRSLGSPDGVARARANLLAGQDSPALNDGWQRVEAALTRLRNLSEQRGFRTAIIAFPIPQSLDKPYPHSQFLPRLRSITDSLGLPVLDLEPVYREVYDGHESLYIRYDGDHPNAAGHALTARAIADFLERQQSGDESR